MYIHFILIHKFDLNKIFYNLQYKNLNINFLNKLSVIKIL